MDDQWVTVADAIKSNHIDVLHTAINQYIYTSNNQVTEFTDKYNQNILHIAVLYSDINTISYIINHYPLLINSVDHYSRTPLYHISSIRHIELLCTNGANINQQDNDGNTVLHILTQQNKLQLIDLLITQYDADADIINNKGQSILHISAQYGYTELLELYIDKYRLDVNLIDSAGWSSLMYCSLGSWPQYESHSECIQSLINHSANINHTDKQGMNALHVCTDSPAVRILLQHNINPYALDLQLHNPLYYTNAENTIIILDYVELHDGIDSVYKLVYQRDIYQRTILHSITDSDKILVLQRFNIDMNIIDQFGKTALDYAIETQRGNIELVLRKLGAQSNRYNYHKYIVFVLTGVLGIVTAKYIKQRHK